MDLPSMMNLSFDVNVKNLCLKVSQRIAVLSKIKPCLPHRERIIYYMHNYKGKPKQSFKVTEESSPGDFKSGHISTISRYV